MHLPDCAQVTDEWNVNQIDPDLQVHILTAIHGNKMPPKSLSRILSNLNIQHDPKEGVREMRRKLKSYTISLRKNKTVEHTEQQKIAVAARHNENLQNIRQSSPQIIPQSLKDKIIHLFRQQTSSEALATFTCASCAESVLLRSHCTLSLHEFDIDVLK